MRARAPGPFLPSLSTSFAGRGAVWDEVERRLDKLGVGEVELSYNVGAQGVIGAMRASIAGTVRVLSLHAPCPNDAPKLPNPLSDDPAEVEAFTRSLRRTVEWAVRFGSRAVVVHLGTLEGLEELETRVMELRAVNDKRWVLARYGLSLERRLIISRKLDTAYRVLESGLREADRWGVPVAVENRFYQRDFPNEEELDELFVRFKGGPLRYWHDTGHGHMRQLLGTSLSAQEAEKRRDVLVGYHIHDALGRKDHLLPGEGNVDFDPVLSCAAGEVVAAMEPGAGRGDDELAVGFARMKAMLGKIEKETA